MAPTRRVTVSMGKKSKKDKKGGNNGKGEKQLEEKNRQACINKAMFDDDGNVRDVLVDFAPFTKYDRHDLDLQIAFHSAESFQTKYSKAAFDLLKGNMHQHYIDANWGWNDAEKQRELSEAEARFLVVTEKEEFMGFCHFRFLIEGDVEALYIYEVQIDDRFRRKGVGKRLMQILELVARKWEMKYMFLTVFQSNVNAMQFYMQKCKYQIDDSSPSMCYLDSDAKYEILSKPIGGAK